MPPLRRPPTTIGGRRIMQGLRGSGRSDRLVEREVDSEDACSETAEDILARSPPPDEPEYISKMTKKAGMFWAPLLSGSTQAEKEMMDQERAAAGKFEYPGRYHAQYIETRINSPGSLHRQHFVAGQDPGKKVPIAGVPNEPINLDPPGAGGPFDALKYPKALVARLNRVPDDPDGLPYGWDDKALKKIPYNIIAKLPAETLAALPESFRSSLPWKVQARDQGKRPQRTNLPAASRATRRSHWLSTIENAFSTWDPEARSTSSIIPTAGRWESRSKGLPSEDDESSASNPEESSTSSVIPEISRWKSRSKGFPGEEDETSIRNPEEPPARAMLRAVGGSTQSQPPAMAEEERSTKYTKEPPAGEMLSAVGRSIRRSQRLSARHEDIPQSSDLPAPLRRRQPEHRMIYPPIPGILDNPERAYNTGSTGPTLSPEPPVAKKRGRGKIAHACNYCKTKKMKCDGAKPSCTSCQNFRVRCSFRDGNAQQNNRQQQEQQQQQADEDELEEQIQEPLVGQMDGPTDEQSPTSSAHDIHRDVLVTVPELEDRGLAAAGNSGPMLDDSDTEDATIDLHALGHQAFLSVSGITRELVERFIERSATDYLALSNPTSIPLKFYPKPMFSQMPNFPKRTRARTAHAYIEMRTPQEENFMARPSVRIVVPDHLKNLLVDDWEYVTKSMLMVPLPSKAPVNFIIDSYFDEEKGKRRLGSAEADVLEEFVAGMKVYFDKAIGKTLLYKFERPQWAEIRQLWESGKYPEWNGKGPGDAYGAEHLCRMLVNMPEMVAQTNMDIQSINRLREEISRLCTWLARNSGRFFCAKYEKPTAEYIEGAR